MIALKSNTKHTHPNGFSLCLITQPKHRLITSGIGRKIAWTFRFAKPIAHFSCTTSIQFLPR